MNLSFQDVLSFLDVAATIYMIVYVEYYKIRGN